VVSGRAQGSLTDPIQTIVRTYDAEGSGGQILEDMVNVLTTSRKQKDGCHEGATKRKTDSHE
jgi:hypothetical protein